jgi:hypothetical protein
MTPLELFLYSEGYAEKEKEANKLALTQAYASAVWSRAKKIPKLETILKGMDKKPKKKKQSAEELLETIKALNIAFGGT